MTDVGIQRVREVRRAISGRFDHDPNRLLEYYSELQKEFADRLLVSQEQTGQPPKAGTG